MIHELEISQNAKIVHDDTKEIASDRSVINDLSKEGNYNSETQYKSESMSANLNPNDQVKRVPVTEPKSVINDTGRKDYHNINSNSVSPKSSVSNPIKRVYSEKSESTSNPPKVKLSQNAKVARYKSESVSTNLNPNDPVKRVPLTEPKSVINDSGQRYRGGNSRGLFIPEKDPKKVILDQFSALKLLQEKRGTFHKPGKYNFLLLIIISVSYTHLTLPTILLV